MKIRIYETTQRKHSDSKGSVGFTSACFAFAVGFLFISPASLTYVQNMKKQLFPSQDPLSQLWFGSRWCITRVARLSLLPEHDWQEQGPHHLFITFALQWHKLKTPVPSPMPLSLPFSLGIPICFQLNLLFNWRFSLGIFSHFPCFQGREYTESTASNNFPHPCPTHPCYEKPDQPP